MSGKRVVIDASVALKWRLRDEEATQQADALLEDFLADREGDVLFIHMFKCITYLREETDEKESPAAPPQGFLFRHPFRAPAINPLRKYLPSKI